MNTQKKKESNGNSNFLTSKNRNLWSCKEFWMEKLSCLKLDISDGSVSSSDDSQKASSSDSGKKRRRELREQGFSLVNSPIADADDISTLRKGIEYIHNELGLPASFIILFDAAWRLAAESKKLLEESTLESNHFHTDILAWYIENDGFSPHRDRQPEGDTTRASFVGDDAKFVTHWIALTEASPENSCLYMLPKSNDPGYLEGDSDEDPLRVALPNKESYQHIRAIPRRASESILFTHRIIHWGSKRAPDTDLSCRIAISFVCSDPTYERPYVDPKYLPNPPFRIRLLLVCAQMLIYYQRFDLSKDFIRACYEYCKDMEDELEETYRQKVYVEFVKAMKEHQDSGVAPERAGEASSGREKAEDLSDEEAEEAMMEEMLNAAKKGYGDFSDDYDEEFGNGDAGAFDEDDDDEPEEDAVLLFAKRPPPNDSNGNNPKKRR